MKDIPIKFRGRFWLKDDYVETTLADGDFVYGGYARLNFLADDGEGDYIVDKNGTARLVYPDSVAQLLGYDVDGAEIYEGDEIENTDLLTGKTFCVKAGYCGINYAHFNFKLAGGNDE